MHGGSDEGVRLYREFILGGNVGDVDFQQLIAHLVVSTGMTWEAVREQFDIPRVSAMQEYWKSNPPMHQLVAAYFGFGGKKPAETDLSELLSIIPEVKR